MAPALIEDINCIVVECSGKTGSFIQDDVEITQIPVVPTILVLAPRVSVLLQNVSAFEIIDSDLGDLRVRSLSE